MLYIARQQIKLLFAENIIEVIHAAFGAPGNDFLKAFGAFLQGIFGLKTLTRCAFTEHTMTTGAALEIEGLGGFKFLIGDGRWLVLSKRSGGCH